MKYVISILSVMMLATGCMFVNESYAPAEGGGYQFEGSCVGYTWEECQARADAACKDVDQTVLTSKHSGGPQNDPGVARVPKRTSVTCQEK